MVGKELNLKKLRLNNSGSTPVIIICSIIIILLFAALISDIGYAKYYQYKLDKMAEQSALLGAEGLIYGEDDATKFIRTYILSQNAELDRSNPVISKNGEVTVILKKKINYWFLSFFNIEEKIITSRSTAMLSPAVKVKGVRPFAVLKDTVQFEGTVFLFENDYSNEQKNKFFITGYDGDNYLENITKGNDDYTRVSDSLIKKKKYDPQTVVKSIGDLIKASKEKDNNHSYSDDGKCTIIIPVVEDNDEEKIYLKVAGFAAFILESAHYNDEGVTLKGKFIKKTINSETRNSCEDFGLYGINIIE